MIRDQASAIAGSAISGSRDRTGASAGSNRGSSGGESGQLYSRIGPFRIGERTGDVELAGTLDRETNFNFTLTVLASDSGSPPLTSTALLHVVVRGSSRISGSY